MNPPVLLHGDCLELMQIIPDKSVDMILCDLPYGTTACKWDVVIPFDKLWTQYERIIKDNGAIVLFGSEPFSSALRMSNINLYKYDWVWIKNQGSNFTSTKFQPMKEHETISVFGEGKTKYFPIPQERADSSKSRLKYDITPYKGNKREALGSIKDSVEPRSYDEKQRGPSSYQFFDVVPRWAGTFHPTQKPVPLLEYLIKTYTNAGELVLDNTMGSGSTGVACVNTGRDFIGIEKDDKYFTIAEKRIAEAQSKEVKDVA